MEQNYNYLFDHVVIIEAFEELAGYKIDQITYNEMEVSEDGNGDYWQTIFFKSGDKVIIYKNSLSKGEQLFWGSSIIIDRTEDNKWFLRWEPRKPDLENPTDYNGKIKMPFEMKDIENAIDLGVAKYGLKVIAEHYLKDCGVMLQNAAKIKIVTDLVMAKQKVKELEKQVSGLKKIEAL